MNTRTQIAIIGAGPAGMMAAEILAQAGCAVTIYDHKPSAGRKFLLAGRGGLNLTHSEPLPDFLSRYADRQDDLAPALATFPPAALRAWCDGLGEESFVGSSGRIFPKSFKASPLLRAWHGRLNERGVRFIFQHHWRGWDEDGALAFTGADSVRADAALLALGGASWPRLGSDGGWVDVLRDRGVAVAPLRPANCGFLAAWSESFRSRLAGQPVKPVTLRFGARTVKGEIMITERGLEGGAIYALSAPLRDAIAAEGRAELSIDLRPGVSIEVLAARLAQPPGRQSAATFLRKAGGMDTAAYGLLREVAGPALRQHAPAALAALIKNLPVTLTGTAGLDRAISTAGGVTFASVDDHFMLKSLPGVFVAGEMLDWEAPTGGYLLQASFSTAVAAANGILAWLNENSAPPERL